MNKTRLEPTSILVTGGAGCIGAELAEALLRDGRDVTVVDNLSSGRLEHIQPLIANPRFRFVEGDMLEDDTLNDALEGISLVFHLAANPDVKFQEGEPTDKDLRQNTLATYRLLEAMRRRGIKRLAFASTSAVYGIAEKLPIAEDHPARPISLYGASKLACESLILAFQHLFEMQCWIFRFANIVGPRVRKNGQTVISDFIRKLQENPQRLEIMGNGKQAKSYLLNSECVEAMLFAISHVDDAVSILNLGCDDWLSVDRIGEMVCEAMELSDVEFGYTGTEGGWPGDVPRFRLDVTAINRLGWKAKHNSEAAVAQTIAAMLKKATV